MSGAPIVGVVEEYDGRRGLGTVSAGGAAGGPSVKYPFHCTAIADGTRQIEERTTVAFVLVAAIGGILEARSVTPISAVVER